MYKFSQKSEERLMTCHPALIKVARFAIQAVDFAVICGYRNEEEQNAAYPKYTTVKYPNSKHNYRNGFGAICSLAFDFLPYDNAKKAYVAWDDVEMFAYVAGHILMAGFAFDVPLRWGHDWDMNDAISDEHGLVDRPHVEMLHYMTEENWNI